MKSTHYRMLTMGYAQIFLVVVALVALPWAASAAQMGTAMQGQAAAPKEVQVQWQPYIPEIPAGVCPECNLGKVNRQLPKPAMKLPEGIQAPSLPETQAGPMALPGDLSFFKKHLLTDAESSTSTSNVLEPTTAQYGNKILYTGNWFAAKSIACCGSYYWFSDGPDWIITDFPPKADRKSWCGGCTLSPE